MELLATLSSISNFEELSSLSDGIVVYTSDFSSFRDNGLTKNKIIKILSISKKKIFIDIEFMLENDRIEEITEFINDVKKYNPYYIVSDLGVFQILKELGLEEYTIYNPNTLITNSYDLNFYLNFKMYAQISEEITLHDQLKMINQAPGRVVKQLFGYHLMFHSKRHLISLYQTYLNKNFKIDNNNSYLIEQTRKDKYHIVETNMGTSLYRPYVLDNSAELLSLNNLAFGLIDDHFIKYEDYIKVLKTYKEIKEGLISEQEGSSIIKLLGYNIEDGFKYEDTVYQKELISCQ